MLIRASACCALIGLVLALIMLRGPAPAPFLWSWLAAGLLAGTLVPVLRWGPQPPLTLFAALWPLLIAGGARISATADLAVDALYFTLLGALLAGSRDAFRLHEKTGGAAARPGVRRVLAALSLCGVAWLALGLVFGPSLAGWSWLLLGRGVLLAAACLPVVFTLRAGRRALAVTLAVVLSVVGAVPLLPHFAWETLLQNAPVGLLAGHLLGRAAAPAAASEAAAGGNA